MKQQLHGSLIYLGCLGVVAATVTGLGGGWAPLMAWIVATPVVICFANMLDKMS
jgi:hypothetical protein